MKNYISNELITSEYNTWIKRKHFDEPIKINRFVSFIENKYKDSGYKYINESISYWRNTLKRFIRIRNGVYIDPLFQELLYSKYINKTIIRTDRSVLATLRIDDSTFPKRKGKLLTNLDLDLPNEIYDKKLSKETKELFTIRYAIKYLHSCSQTKLNLSKYFNKYNIDTSKIKSNDKLVKIINKKIKEIYKKDDWKKTFLFKEIRAAYG